jgi:NADH-quinone oxidoreductase subunit A
MTDHPYFSVLVSFALAGGVVSIFLLAARVLGPKRSSAVKGLPFECGNPPSGSAWSHFSVHFYLVAMLFLIFDVEVVFLYPWAVLFRDLGMFGLIEMGFFLLFLLIGLAYAWGKGALDWK